MAEPDWNPDTAGRPLAEILREAGIDTSRAARRRRWDDPDDTGIRQRSPDGADDTSRPGYGRRLGDASSPDENRGRGERRGADTGRRPDDTGRRRPDDTGRGRLDDTGRRPDDTGRRRIDSGRRSASPGPGAADTGRSSAATGRSSADTGRRAAVTGRTPRARAAPEPSTAAIRGMRPSGKPEVPGTSASVGAAPPQRTRRTAEGERDGRGERFPESKPQHVATPGTETSPGTRRTGSTRPRSREAADEDFSTGPIPVVRDGEPVPDSDEDATPAESALAWLRFAGELLIALVAGVGVYFLATVLWEQLPQLAVFLSPLAVTGLVAGVSVWRQRLGRGPLGAPLLAVLVFAGALLTVMPAASLLAG